MKSFLANQAFLWSLLLNAALYALAYYCFYPQYGTIDDTEMQLVASGVSLSPVPSPNLRWTHIFVGYLLSQLYTLQPDLPWYGMYLYSAHFLGTTALVYTAFKMEMSWFRLVGAGALLLCFQYPILQEVQYTPAAATLGIGGAALLFLAFFKSDSRWASIWYGVGFLLFAAAGLMRWHALLMVSIMMIPLWGYVIFQTGGRWWLRLLLLLLPLGAATGLEWMDKEIQSKHSGWKDFHQLVSVGFGHDILDYHIERYQWTDETMPIYWKNGWSYNDYQLFTHWFMADSSVFGLHKQRDIKAIFEEKMPKYTQSRLETRLTDFVQNNPLPTYLYFVFLFTAWVCMVAAPRRSIYATILLTMLGGYALCVLLYTLYHLPDRVSFAIGYAIAAVATLWAGYQVTTSRTIIWGSVLLIGVGIAMPTLKNTWKKSKNVYVQYTRYAQAYKQLNPQPHQIYAMAPSFFQERLVMPLNGIQDDSIDLRKYKAVDFGNLSIAPTFYEQLDALGVQKSIHTHLIDNPNGFLLYRPNRPHWDWYAQYLAEHHRDTMRYQEYMRFPELDIILYQMTRDTLPVSLPQ